MNIEDYYQDKVSYSLKEIKRYERLVDVYSFARLFAIALGIYLVYFTLQFQKPWITEFTLIGITFFFLWLVSKQSGFTKKRDFYSALRDVNENELGSILAKTNIYSDGSGWNNDQHPYSSDLDIFGQGSLYQLINRCSIRAGNQKLADWLSLPANVEHIRERQEFIKELGASPDWKLAFQSTLLFARHDERNEPKRLINYLKQVPEPSISSIVRFYIKWISALFFPVIFLAFYFPVFKIFAFVLAVLNISIIYFNETKIKKVREQIGNAGNVLSNYSEGFDLILKSNWISALGTKLKLGLKNERDIKISEQIKQLSILISRFDTGKMGVVGFLLNLSITWDLRLVVAIENWKNTNESLVEHAFDILSDVEAIISLSSLHTNYPEWGFPEVLENKSYTFTANKVGHPLIEPNLRVVNDFNLYDTRKIDIITGSNMAGKSTFLRTLGINAVLAFSGAPVCAESMTLTRMYIFTYMRIRDSINESTSTFKAELDRLQQLLKKVADGEKVYFLIDEMLRGTNSVDKYLGSKAIIEKLIAQQAVGIVATHDLQIAQLEQKYPDYVRNFYFDIRMEGTEMLFDYKLKDGECKTFNALQLLKKLGIEVDPQV